MSERKVLATIGSGPMAGVLALSGPTMRRYADRHGYDFVAGDGESGGRPPAWGKVLLIQRLLREYDTVLWVDADAIILDDSSDLAEEVPSDAYQALSLYRIAHDWWGHHGNPGDDVPNSGVWLLRGDRGRAFIDAVWSQTSFTDHPWWENAAVMHLLGFSFYPCKEGPPTEWTPGTTWLDLTWNSCVMFTGVAPARIRHYAGIDNRTRVREMRADVGQRQIPRVVRRASWYFRMRGYLPPAVGRSRMKQAARKALGR